MPGVPPRRVTELAEWHDLLGMTDAEGCMYQQSFPTPSLPRPPTAAPTTSLLSFSRDWKSRAWEAMY